MFFRLVCSFILLFQSAFFLAPNSSAQTAKLAVSEGSFSEGYSGQVNVSSSGALIGMRLGSSAAWNLDNVTIIPENDAGSIVCLRSSTLDGRFWAENPYLIEDGSVATSIGPISRTYRKNLKSYPKNEVAFRAAILRGDDCMSKDVEYYVPSIGQHDSILNIFLNSGDRNTFARLSASGTSENISVECENIDGFSSVVADRVCKMNVEDLAGDATLKVLFVTVEGNKDLSEFKIKLPKFVSLKN